MAPAPTSYRCFRGLLFQIALNATTTSACVACFAAPSLRTFVMAKKGFRHFETLDPAAQLTALAMLLTVSHVSADVLCTLSMTSSTTVLQEVSVEVSCSGSASTSTQPHVWIDSSLNPLHTNLTGATSILPLFRFESVSLGRTGVQLYMCGDVLPLSGVWPSFACACSTYTVGKACLRAQRFAASPHMSPGQRSTQTVCVSRKNAVPRVRRCLVVTCPFQ